MLLCTLRVEIIAFIRILWHEIQPTLFHWRDGFFGIIRGGCSRTWTRCPWWPPHVGPSRFYINSIVDLWLWHTGRGDAIFLKSLNRLAIFNLRDGIDVYDIGSQFTKMNSIQFNIDPCCSQAISMIQDGQNIVSPSVDGYIHLYRTQGCDLVGRLHTGIFDFQLFCF